MECPSCGKLIPPEAQICPFCLFLIKDWKEGKAMVNDEGVVMPPYDPKPTESSDQIQSEKIPELETHTYHRRGKTDRSSVPHRQNGGERKGYVETKTKESEKKKTESQKNVSPTVKKDYATPQTHTFRRSPRADQIQEEAIRRKKYGESVKNQITLSVNQNLQERQNKSSVTPPPAQNSRLQRDAQSDSPVAEFDTFNQSNYGSGPDLTNDFYSDAPIDDITNVSFDEEPGKNKKRDKKFGFLVGILVALILALVGVLLVHFFLRVSVGGKSVSKEAFANTKIEITSLETKKTPLSTPKKIKLKMTGQSKYDIPVKNVEILVDGKPVNFKFDGKKLENNEDMIGEVTGIKKYSNNFSLRIISDQKKKLYQSRSDKLVFPFDLAGTYWRVKYKNDINSPDKVLSIYFRTDKTYEETLETASVKYADSNSVKKWGEGAVTGTITQGKADDGSDRYLTNPQSFIETQYLSNHNKGKEPSYRLKYKNGSVPDNLNDYRHEIRMKNNQLYFFLPSANPQSKMQVFLFDEIEPKQFTTFNKADSLKTIKQPGMTAKPEAASEIRKRILYNFVSQLTYELPADKKAQMNTVFYDSPNGQETTGLITYKLDGKDNNLMKFILYRNGRINVYPLNSGFDVPKAYTINIYKDVNSNAFREFPDFKND